MLTKHHTIEPTKLPVLHVTNVHTNNILDDPCGYNDDGDAFQYNYHCSFTYDNDDDDHNQDNCLYSMDLEDVTIVPIIFPSLIESSKEKSTNTIDDKTNHDDPADDDDNDDNDEDEDDDDDDDDDCVMMMIMMNASLGNTHSLCC